MPDLWKVGEERSVCGRSARWQLHDGTVVGHEAVHLDLDVGRLRIDRRGKPFASQDSQLAHQVEIRAAQIREAS